MPHPRHFFIALLFAFALTDPATAQGNAEKMRPVELEVIAAVLNDPGTRLPKEKTWVIDPMNAPLSGAHYDEAARELAKQFPEASKALIADLVAVGEQAVSFDIPRHLLDGAVTVSLADRNFLDGTRGGRQNFWNQFYAKYPGANGLTAFSRVGLDDRNKQALLYVAFSCGGLCGNGFMVFLRKEAGHWKIIRTEHLWVS